MDKGSGESERRSTICAIGCRDESRDYLCVEWGDNSDDLSLHVEKQRLFSITAKVRELEGITAPTLLKYLNHGAELLENEKSGRVAKKIYLGVNVMNETKDLEIRENVEKDVS